MARVLVVLADEVLRDVLEHALHGVGHDVFVARTGNEGLALAREHRPELVLLDLGLPDGPGAEICRGLQRDERTSRIPFVLMSERGDEIDRIVGFELGASDYVVKPFSVRELVLRIQAVLRRTQVPQEEPQLVFGRLRVSSRAHLVWVDGRRVDLTMLEFRLLLTLCEHTGRVLSRATLLDGVWGIDVSITTRTVDTHVKRLRDKLGPAGEYIQTVRGIGYRLTPEDALGGSA